MMTVSPMFDRDDRAEDGCLFTALAVVLMLFISAVAAQMLWQQVKDWLEQVFN